jgi:hypothetical protein
VTIERLDPAQECDPLVPTRVPDPVKLRVDPRTPSCGGGVSDGTGHVAVAAAVGPRGTGWQVFTSDGRAAQPFSLGGELWPLPEGWQGLQAFSSGPASTVDVLTFAPDGALRRTESPRPGGFGPRVAAAGPDPRGGSLLVQWGPLDAAGQACAGEARRYDATGALAGTPGAVGCNVSAAGVSAEGEALILERTSGGTLLRWLRADGSPARPTSVEPTGSTGFPLLPLLDGSLVAQDPVQFTRRYPHLGAAGEPAPAWLAARGGQTFRFTRGNRGYAFFPRPGQQSSDCTQAVELVAPSGRRCARLTFRRDGNACVTGAIDQGWDGTVVQQDAIGACGWRTWPGLLAGP